MKYANVKVTFPALPELNALYSDLMLNVTRVEHLVRVYEDLRIKHRKRRGPVWSHLSDVLRAAVVLCHATLEEGLRGLMYIEVEWTKDFLAQVPIIGTSPANRASKFTLADLLSHKSKKVEDVLEESVFEHLGRTSFNRVEDVVHVIESLGLKPSDFDGFLPDIELMMKRRHNIAHTGDQNRDSGRGHHSIQSISAALVRDWNGLVQVFFLEIAMRLQGKTLVAGKPHTLSKKAADEQHN